MNVSQQISSFGRWARRWAKYDDFLRNCRSYLSGGHRYNHLNITAKEFLFEVMHDQSVPMELSRLIVEIGGAALHLPLSCGIDS